MILRSALPLLALAASLHAADGISGVCARNPAGAIIAADTVSAGPGELVFLVGAREASLALEQPFVPIDAAIVGLVDEVHLADGAKGFLRGRDDVRGAQ